MRSRLTHGWVAKRRDAVPGGMPSKSAHLTAWSAFCSFLVEREVLEYNPCSRVRWPEKVKANTDNHIAKLAGVQRFVASFPTAETRAIAALREGVGADWDALGPMQRRHVRDIERRLVFLPGDERDNRKREVPMEAWSWSYVIACYSATTGRPGDKLFTISQRMYHTHHQRVVAALQEEGVDIPERYTPHCSRHSFAVRKRRDGWPGWKIARFLGNTAAEVAETYGLFRPTRDDLQHDEPARRKGRRGR
jgi:site-specific recombinase XerC